MLDRKVAPSFVKNFSFELIKPDFVTLRNGVHVYFVRGGDQPVVKVELIFHAGRWFEPFEGLSYFTSNLIDKGTNDKNSFHIASLFDQLGAHLEIHSDNDFVTISLYTLAKKLEPSLALLLEVIQYAAFPEKEVDQVKSIYLQNLEVNKEKTSFLASRLFRKKIFGEHHPYGRELNEEDVAKISRDRICEFYKNFFSDFIIVASGQLNDISKDVIIRFFQDLSIRQSGGITHDDDISTERILQHVDKEGSIQSSLRMGKLAVTRSNPDYPALLLLNHILGGFFGSRLMKNIREEKGLTYGIHSSIHAMRQASFLVIGTDVNKKSRDLAFNEIRKECNRLRTELIDVDELDTARHHFIGSIQTELSTAFAHAEKIKTIVLFGLTESYYSELVRKISAVTSEELLTIADRHLNEESFSEISVG